MGFSLEELLEWEQALSQRNMKRMFKTQKNFRCPRRERLRNYRNKRGCGGHFYRKESLDVRVALQRRFRHKLKLQIDNQVYYRPVPHDYKTYGWISW